MPLRVFLIICAVLWLIQRLLFHFVRYFGGNAKRKRQPPGPLGIPIFGYMPFFAYKPLERLRKLASSYGEICTIYLGGYRVVVLSSFYTIREAFKDEAFSGRPDLKMLQVRNGGVHKGLVCSQGKTWNEQRKFTLKHLRDLGFGKQSMEGMYVQEVEELISWLRCKAGTPVDLKSRLNLAVLNALWSIISGQRYSHDDARLKKILEITSADLAETQYTGPLMFLPWLTKFAPRLTRWNKFTLSIKYVQKFLKEIIVEHRENLKKPQGCMKDFIDFYLSHIDKTVDPGSSFFKERGEHSLMVVLLDLLMAGGDTTSATLYWAFLYMVLHEDVQRSVQHEIDLVLGNSFPTLEHRKLMPYTEATILEVLRKSSLVPMGLFHSTTCDTQLLGFEIPKDTVVMANLYNLNYNQAWGDPYVFRPKRFLNDLGTEIIKPEWFIPFSTGIRVCPGANLARDQLFLFLVGLLQKFIFVADFSQPWPTCEPNSGVILSAKPYSVIIRNRIVGAN